MYHSTNPSLPIGVVTRLLAPIPSPISHNALMPCPNSCCCYQFLNVIFCIYCKLFLSILNIMYLFQCGGAEALLILFKKWKWEPFLGADADTVQERKIRISPQLLLKEKLGSHPKCFLIILYLPALLAQILGYLGQLDHFHK